MTGTKMQPEFNQNTDQQPVANYYAVKTGGVLQDAMRQQEDAAAEEEQAPAADKVTDKFSDNAGDNSLTRYEINRSIVAPEFANEHSYIQAMERGIDEIGKRSKP